MVGRNRRSAIVAFGACGFLVASILVVTAQPGGAAGDTTPPVFASLSIAPASIDTSDGPVDLTIDAHLVDASGPSNGGILPLSRVVLTGPHGQQHVTGYLSQAQRIGGTATDGTYRTVVTLRWHAEPGRWSASAVLVDAAGNSRSFTTADLAAAGLVSGIDQTGAGDTTAPQLVALSIAPPSVDTSLNAATLTVSARIVDDLAGASDGLGVNASQVVLRGPTGAHHARATLDVSHRVNGNPNDSTFVVGLTLPHWSEQGLWSVERVDLVDEVGNAVSITASATFTQVGIGDITPPTLRTFSMSTTSVDVQASSATIAMQARISDDRSGVADGIVDSPSSIVFTSPSGHQQLFAPLGLAQRTAGNGIDGSYRVVTTVPAHAEPGAWTLRAAYITDAAGNGVMLSASDWAGRGYPASFTVVSDTPPWSGPTLPPDPSTTSTTDVVGSSSTTVDTGGSTSTTTTLIIDGSSTSTTTTTTVDPAATTTTSVDPSVSTTSIDPSATTTTTPDGESTTTTTPGESTTSVPSGTTVSTTPGATTTTTVPGVGPDGKPLASRADGYWFASVNGRVAGFAAASKTSVTAAGFDAGAVVVGIAATPSGNGYWLATKQGDVRAFGDARVYGSMRAKALAKPIVGIAATTTGKGYWLVATDGGIFGFGDARFYGSTGAIRLNKPIVGMSASPSSRGYWFVASDGGVFAYGDARFFGSFSRSPAAVVGMAVHLKR